jgi:uncharacterized protein YkwD
MIKSWSCIFALVILLAACNTKPSVEIATPTQPSATLTPTVAFTPAAPEATATFAPTVVPSPTPAPSPTAAPTATPSKIQYTVRPGDTLSSLARQYHISMASIQIANGLGESQSLRAGQTLNIPTGPRFEGESTFWIVHVVQGGETLSTIAQAFGVLQSDIARVNGISAPSLVRLGQNLVIPLNTYAVAALPPTPTSQSTPSSSPTATSQPTPTTVQSTPTIQPAPTVPAAPLATSSPLTATPTAAPASVPSDIAGWPNTVFVIINQKRVDSNLRRYKVSPLLTQAAQGLANDCSSRGWCSHVGSDGSDTKTRILRTGYTPVMFGENWVQANDPAGAVAFWYNETPPNDVHRRDLLSNAYTEIGVGIGKAGQGYYFIIDYGSR